MITKGMSLKMVAAPNNLMQSLAEGAMDELFYEEWAWRHFPHGNGPGGHSNRPGAVIRACGSVPVAAPALRQASHRGVRRPQCAGRKLPRSLDSPQSRLAPPAGGDAERGYRSSNGETQDTALAAETHYRFMDMGMIAGSGRVHTVVGAPLWALKSATFEGHLCNASKRAILRRTSAYFAAGRGRPGADPIAADIVHWR